MGGTSCHHHPMRLSWTTRPPQFTVFSSGFPDPRRTRPYCSSTELQIFGSDQAGGGEAKRVTAGETRIRSAGPSLSSVSSYKTPETWERQTLQSIFQIDLLHSWYLPRQGRKKKKITSPLYYDACILTRGTVFLCLQLYDCCWDTGNDLLLFALQYFLLWQAKMSPATQPAAQSGQAIIKWPLSSPHPVMIDKIINKSPVKLCPPPTLTPPSTPTEIIAAATANSKGYKRRTDTTVKNKRGVWRGGRL